MEEKLVTYTLERNGNVFVVEHVHAPVRIQGSWGKLSFLLRRSTGCRRSSPGKAHRCGGSKRRFTSLRLEERTAAEQGVRRPWDIRAVCS